MSKFKKGDLVRLRFGCVWYFGEIAKDYGDGWYECDYGTRKMYEKVKHGWSFHFFASWHESDIKLIEL